MGFSIAKQDIINYNNCMSKKKKPKVFKPFRSCTVRMSDETWKTFKDKKIKSGVSWNRFINKILEK